MKHKVNIKFAGKIVGSGEVSDSGELTSASVDRKKIPEQFRTTFKPEMHVSFADEPQTWENDSQF